MQKIKPTKSQSSNSPRRGTAQMELALFMPAYVSILMVLLTIFSFARTRGEVAVETRHEAWMKRDQPGSETEPLDVAPGDIQTVGRILNHEQDPALGLVSATRQKNATLYLKTLKLLTGIQLNHAVLTDSWDHETLPFEEKENHVRLNLGKRVSAFGSVNRGSFGGLASATFSDAVDAGKLRNSLDRERNRASDQINRQKASVVRDIATTKRTISSLKAELSELKKMVPPDEEQIRELSNRISSEERKLAGLSHQLAQLNAAIRFVSGNLTAAGSA